MAAVQPCGWQQSPLYSALLQHGRGAAPSSGWQPVLGPQPVGAPVTAVAPAQPMMISVPPQPQIVAAPTPQAQSLSAPSVNCSVQSPRSILVNVSLPPSTQRNALPVHLHPMQAAGFSGAQSSGVLAPLPAVAASGFHGASGPNLASPRGFSAVGLPSLQGRSTVAPLPTMTHAGVQSSSASALAPLPAMTHMVPAVGLAAVPGQMHSPAGILWSGAGQGVHGPVAVAPMSSWASVAAPTLGVRDFQPLLSSAGILCDGSSQALQGRDGFGAGADFGVGASPMAFSSSPRQFALGDVVGQDGGEICGLGIFPLRGVTPSASSTPAIGRHLHGLVGSHEVGCPSCGHPQTHGGLDALWPRTSPAFAGEGPSTLPPHSGYFSAESPRASKSTLPRSTSPSLMPHRRPRPGGLGSPAMPPLPDPSSAPVAAPCIPPSPTTTPMAAPVATPRASAQVDREAQSVTLPPAKVKETQWSRPRPCASEVDGEAPSPALPPLKEVSPTAPKADEAEVPRAADAGGWVTPPSPPAGGG
uniref:Uncharacterized protein n=1 Tax=Zooxanthella nutricula TaxID=1333877 RepID=A0A6U9L044_9DINO